MATLNHTRTNAFFAASRALDGAVAAAIGDVPGAVSGTTFVPADLAGAGRVGRYRRLGPGR
jgi:hypothetical protein